MSSPGGGKLSQRLGYLRNEKKEKQSLRVGMRGKEGNVGRPPAAPALSGLAGGWERAGEWVYRRETVFPFGLPDRIAKSPLIPRSAETSDLLFFDTETTGLSGGAGNMAFLVGIGERRGDDSFAVSQYFLSDYPGESELLRLLLSRFVPSKGGARVFVSYNGKAFDSHLLSSRFIMHGMRFHFSDHIDLLYPVRRLWGRILPSCSLSVVERELLGFSRERDVPGSQIPEIYFSFVRSKDASLLDDVFEHNNYDILTLAKLLKMLHHVAEDPRAADAPLLGSLGRLYLRSDPALGTELLKSAYRGEDGEAGRVLSTHFKRTGALPEAVRIWLEMWRKTGSLFAGTELAKYYEHRERDFARALEIVEKLSRAYGFDGNLKKSLSHRRQRLRQRLEREAVMDSSPPGKRLG